MDVVEPICNSNGVIVKNSYSIISSGTESKSVNTAKSSLIGKAINSNGFRSSIEYWFVVLKNESCLGFFLTSLNSFFIF